MKLAANIFLIFSLALLSVRAFSQSVDTIDYYSLIRKFDLGKLWRSDSLLIIEHDYDKGGLIFFEQFMEDRADPLGFMGNDYQRLYVHYLSVKKSNSDPYQYMVSGKIKLKNKICKFRGTITIKQAKVYPGTYDIKYKQGLVYCECKFFEDKTELLSGLITGTLKTKFYLDSQQHLFYDDLDIGSDGYRNNEFTGILKNYKSGNIMKCNWGDFRIPDCGDLDIGVGEFSINEKYMRNGWRNYTDANWGGYDTVQTNKAKKIENEHWWE